MKEYYIILLSGLVSLIVGFFTSLITYKLNVRKDKIVQEKNYMQRYIELKSNHKTKIGHEDEITFDDRSYSIFANQHAVGLLNINIKDDVSGWKYLLPRNTSHTVGRDNDNDLILDDREVSRTHARFIVKNDNVYIQCLNATNQTYVNDDMLDSGKEVCLSSGDRIQMGSVKMSYIKLETV